MTFDQLNLGKPLMNAIRDLEFVSPTPIQEKVFPIIMSGRDVVGIAQTGTGKTFAYLLPILRRLDYSEKRYPRVLIIVPTRELVVQVMGEIKKLTTYMTVRVDGVYGGTNINTQKQMVYDGLDILVATPGRLYDLTMTGVLRLKSIQKLIIDEVDEMLNLGFRGQLITFFETLPEKRQNLMFSATLSEDVATIINNFFYNPLKLEITSHGTPLERIIQKAYHVPNFNTKANLLEYLIKNDGDMTKVLVFANNKKLADRLYEKLNVLFPDLVGVIHSNKAQNNRFNTVTHFDDGTIRILIATDIIARGLDIKDVTHVINFDTPDIPGDYIHRIGRTGRADKDGIAITLINEPEQEFQMAIEEMMGIPIPIEDLPEDLEISTVFTDEERPLLYDKNYLQAPFKRSSQGAFHEKKEKNMKENSGSPAFKVKKHKKPIKRSGKN